MAQSPWELILNAYRKLVPKALRRRSRDWPGLKWLRTNLWEADTRLHNAYYDEAYYRDGMDEFSRDAAPKFAASAIDRLAPKSVIDVGCGSGLYLKAFADQGVDGHGAELADAALTRCRSIGLDVVKHDLSKDQPLPWQADMVYSVEVAEHLAEKYARNFVKTIASAASKHAVITAAPPGQGGTNHINCQPAGYWIRLFEDQGFEYERLMSEQWRQANAEAGMPEWFCINLLVFRRAQ